MLIRVFVVALFLGFVSSAQAAPPARHRLVHQGLVGARLNPLGATARWDVGYRYKLYDSDSILLNDAWAGASVVPMLTPSFGRIGVAAFAEPLTVLRLEVAYDRIRYFAVMDELQSFPDANADYSPDTRAARGRSVLNYGAGGSQLSMGGRLQAKLGAFAARNALRFTFMDMQLAEGDTTFYDSVLDILAPGHGWVFTNDADLLWLRDEHLVVGVRYSSVGALHPDAGGWSATHRAGPLVAYTFENRPGARFTQPTLLLLVNWWISHPYRSGQAVSPLVPYVSAGFAFSGDLL